MANHFETLSAILFDGPVVVDHIAIVPGTDPTASREDLAKALLESMTRVGLIKDNRLQSIERLA